MKKIIYCGICCLIACQGLQALKNNEAAKDNTVAAMTNATPVAENDDGCIDLSGRKLDDRGLEEFCKTLRPQQEIKRLDLSNNEITYKGLASFLERCESMRGIRPGLWIDELVIDNNPIKTVGGALLAAAYHNSTLQGRISVKGCGINEKLVKDLEELSRLGGRYVDALGRYIRGVCAVYHEEWAAYKESIKRLLFSRLEEGGKQREHALYTQVWDEFWYSYETRKAYRFSKSYFDRWYRDNVDRIRPPFRSSSLNDRSERIVGSFRAIEEDVFKKGVEARNLEKKIDAFWARNKPLKSKEAVKQLWDDLVRKHSQPSLSYSLFGLIRQIEDTQYHYKGKYMKPDGELGPDLKQISFGLQEDEDVGNLIELCKIAPNAEFHLEENILSDVGIGKLVSSQEFKDSNVCLMIGDGYRECGNLITREMRELIHVLENTTSSMKKGERDCKKAVSENKTLERKVAQKKEEVLQESYGPLVLQRLDEWWVDSMTVPDIEKKANEEWKKAIIEEEKLELKYAAEQGIKREKLRLDPWRDPYLEYRAKNMTEEEMISLDLVEILSKKGDVVLGKSREDALRKKYEQDCEKRSTVIADIETMYTERQKFVKWEEKMQEYKDRLEKLYEQDENDKAEEEEIKNAIAALEGERAEIESAISQVMEKYSH